MNTFENFRGWAKPKRYVPPRPNFTVEQRLDECQRIAERIECGEATPIDEIALRAHLRVLRQKPLMDYEDDAIAKAFDELSAAEAHPKAYFGGKKK